MNACGLSVIDLRLCGRLKLLWEGLLIYETSGTIEVGMLILIYCEIHQFLFEYKHGKKIYRCCTCMYV